MKYTKAVIAVILLQFPLSNPIAAQQGNKELKQMHAEDQTARMAGHINWEILSQQDSLRRVRAYQLIDSGRLNTGMDYYHAAMIFQHGKYGDTTSSTMAIKLMRKALTLDSSVNRWLLAAAIDRDLMYREQPQIYGTQFTADTTNPNLHLYTIDTTKISDAERQYYRVGAMAEIREKERVLRLKSLDTFYESTKNMRAILSLIKSEKQKGLQATYGVNEKIINSFGYRLLRENKNEEALAVFQLNTELYPKAYNTYDSLGECLVKLKRKKAAIEAYEKAVKRNPAYEKGFDILKELKAH